MNYRGPLWANPASAGYTVGAMAPLSKEKGWAPWRKQSWISDHADPPGWVSEASQQTHLSFICDLPTLPSEFYMWSSLLLLTGWKPPISERV